MHNLDEEGSGEDGFVSEFDGLSKQVNVRMPASMKKDLEDLAKERWTSTSALAREAVVDYLKLRSDMDAATEVGNGTAAA